MLRKIILIVSIVLPVRLYALTEAEKIALVETVKYAYLNNQQKLNFVQLIFLKLFQYETEILDLKRRVEELEAKSAVKDL